MVGGKFKVKMTLPVFYLLLAAALYPQAAVVGGAEEAAKPVTEWGGQYCSETRPQIVVIRSQAGLPRLRGSRLDPAQVPDFRKAAIVGVFLGQRLTGGFRVEFKEPYIQDGKLIVPFQEHAPGPGSFVTQALTTPCGFKIVPVKPGQEVVIQNIQKVADLTYRPLRLQTGHFQCDIPQNWYWERQEAGTSPNPYYQRDPASFPGEIGGLMLMAPPEMEGEGVRIFVARYVPQDQPPPAGLQTYLEKYPPDDLFKYSFPEKFQAAQPPANSPGGQWFARQTVVSLRGTGNKLPIKELLGVIPAQSGFYALHYWAPAALAEKYAPVFHRVVQSFQPVP